MGSEQKESIALVNVVLDKINYFPGDKITGFIKILPKPNINPKSFNVKKIIFSIFQQKNWQSYMFSEEQKSSSTGQSNKNYICEKTKVFNEFKKKDISEGLQIPFIYIIPKEITPTLEWPHAKFEFAYIRNFFSVKIPELNYENQILIIIQKPPDKIQKPIIISEKKNEGKIIIQASCPQSSYAILSQIPLSLSIDTIQSGTKIKEITVKLKRNLDFGYLSDLKKSRNYKEVMYYETRKVNGPKENFLFQIPFKDGSDIKYHVTQAMLDTTNEICCLIPNVDTDIIKVYYYIKITMVVDKLLSKNIELKMKVYFHSKDEKKTNENIFDHFGQRFTLINHGKLKFNNDDPYTNNNFNMTNINNMNRLNNLNKLNNLNNDQLLFIGGNVNNIFNNNNNPNTNNNIINNLKGNKIEYKLSNSLLNDPNRKIIKEKKNNFPSQTMVNNNNGNDLDLPSLTEVQKGQYEYNKMKNFQYPET